MLAFQQTTLQSSIAQLQKDLQTSQTSLKELVKPTDAPAATTKGIIKTGIKYGIAGFIGGIFLMILIYAVRILMKGKILTDDELNVAYGLRNIMTYPAGTGRKEYRSAIDRLVNRLVNDGPDISMSAANDVTIAKVESMSAPSGIHKVMLAGTVGETRLESFAKTLTKRAEAIGSTVTFEAAPRSGYQCCGCPPPSHDRRLHRSGGSGRDILPRCGRNHRDSACLGQTGTRYCISVINFRLFYQTCADPHTSRYKGR